MATTTTTTTTTNRFPVVIRDQLGRPSLYAGPAFTSALVDRTTGEVWSFERSQAFLGDCLREGLRRGVYAHEWRQGDFVVWCNRCLLHSATETAKYKGQHRLHHRIRLASKLPVVAAAAAAAAGTTQQRQQLYARLWALQQLLSSGFFDFLARVAVATTTTFKTSNFSLASQTTLPPTGTLGIWFVSFAVLAFCPRNRTLLLAAHVGNVLVHAAKIPFVWDYEYWDLLVELAVIFYGGSVDDAAPVARAQMLLFYYATAFYKFTTSFLSRAVSCGPIFVLALLDLVTPAAFSISPEALTVLTALSPPTTILVELAVPTLLLLKPKFGILLGLLFHLLITLQPPPSNAGGFSVSVAVRYAFFVGGFF